MDKELLHSILHGDYTAISNYHSAELLNRLNNDVRVVNEGIVNVFPNVVAMVIRAVAVVAVLAAMDVSAEIEHRVDVLLDHWCETQRLAIARVVPGSAPVLLSTFSIV